MVLLGHFQPGTGGPEGQQGLDVVRPRCARLGEYAHGVDHNDAIALSETVAV